MTKKQENNSNINKEISPEDTASQQTNNDAVSAKGTEEDLEKMLETAENEIKDTYDRLLRVSAEFENYKKRVSRETDEFKKYANEALISALLPIMDNLERAIDAFRENHSDQESLLEGVLLTHAEILKVLEKFGVVSIDAAGKPFDPNYHEAVMQETAEDHPDNTVIRELQKGYLMHNRLLRPSMVVVSKKE
ncbi:MAG: nucleotide exchange factor GrpE [Desulfobacterales bacterium]